MQAGHQIHLVFLIAGAVALSAITGLAFAAWLDHGDNMLFSMIQSGLSWCF